MIIITQKPVPKMRSSRNKGFTLVEVLIAAGLASFVMVGILSAFLFLTRAGLSTQNYADMEIQSRTAMEIFAQDVRVAEDIRWNSSTSLTLTVEIDDVTKYFTYAYNSGSATFTRQQVSSPSTQGAIGSATTLITGIKSGTFQYTAYKIDTGTIDLTTVSDTTNMMTKQVQIALETERAQSGLAVATNKVISARFILRNKKVTA